MACAGKARSSRDVAADESSTPETEFVERKNTKLQKHISLKMKLKHRLVGRGNAVGLWKYLNTKSTHA